MWCLIHPILKSETVWAIISRLFYMLVETFNIAFKCVYYLNDGASNIKRINITFCAALFSFHC